MLTRLRKSRWTRAIFALCAWTSLFLVLGYVALNIAARVAIRSLATQLGFADVAFEVRSVSLRRCVLGNVQLPGTDAPSLATLTAEYAPLDLLSGKLRALRISGLEIAIDPTGHILGLPTPTSRATPNSTNFSLSPADLPTHIDITSSTLRLQLPTGPLQAPLTLHYETSGTTGKAAAHLSLGSDNLTLTATGNPNADWTLSADAALSISSILPLLPPHTLPHATSINGRATLTATYDLQSHTGHANLTLADAFARTQSNGHPIALSNLNLELELALSPTDLRSGLTTSATLQADWLDGETQLLLQAVGSGTTPSSPTLSTTAWSASLTANGPSLQLSATDIHLTPDLSAAHVTFVAHPSAWALTSAKSAGLLLASSTAIAATADLQRLADGTLLARLATPTLSAPTVASTDGSLELIEPRVSAAALNASGRPGETWNLELDNLDASSQDARSTSHHAPAHLTSTTLSAQLAPDGTLTLSAPDLLADAGPMDLSLSSATTPPTSRTASTPTTQPTPDTDPLASPQISALTAHLHLALSATPQEIRATLRDSSRLSLAAIDGPNDQFHLGPAHWSLTPRAHPTTPTTAPAPAPTTAPTTEPAPPLFLYRRGHPIQLAFNSQTTAPVHLTSPNGSADIAHIVANVETQLADQIPLDGYIRLDGADVTLPSLDVTLKGTTLRLPLSLDATTPRQGEMKIDSVQRGPLTLPGITGQLWATRRAAYCGFDWPIVSEGTVKAELRADFPHGKTTVDLHAWIPEFGLTRAEEIRKLLPPALADADIAGRFAADLRYSIVDGKVARWGSIDVKDASMRSTQLADTRLTGVSGRIWTRSFSPLETAPGQTLSVESAQIGKLAVSKGNVRFRIDPGDILFVEDASFGFAGGTVSARGFRVAPTQSAAELVLYADKLNVADVAKLASDGRVTGTGKLFARLPISLNWADRRVAIGTGYVYAEGGGGAVSLGPNASDVAKLIGRQTSDNIVVDRLTSAFTNFKYSAFTLELNRTPESTLSGSIRFSGQGGTGTSGQGLNLTVNLNDLQILERHVAEDILRPNK